MNSAATNSIRIGKKAFVSSFVILLVLLVLAGLLTRAVPAGSYARHIGADGLEVIDVESFEYSDSPSLPAWRWLTAPIEVLGSSEGAVVIGIIVFFLCIGGSISLLNQCGVFSHMIGRVIARYGARREQLIAATVFVLMLISALTGIVEEAVFLVPLMIPLAAGLGMDPIVGLGMSFLATGFGFAAGLTNPFTIGVAQRVAGVPLFSGLWYRALVFATAYAVLIVFLIRHARRSPGLQGSLSAAPARERETAGRDSRMDRASRWFVASMGAMLCYSLAASVVPALSEFSFAVTTLLFLAGGIGAAAMVGAGGRRIGRVFVDGVVAMAPGVVLMLMAAGVKHIIAEAGILDTIIFAGARMVEGMPRTFAAAVIYLLVLGVGVLHPVGVGEVADNDADPRPAGRLRGPDQAIGCAGLPVRRRLQQHDLSHESGDTDLPGVGWGGLFPLVPPHDLAAAHHARRHYVFSAGRGGHRAGAGVAGAGAWAESGGKVGANSW